ncbi:MULTISPECIES: TIGR01212 family radical SAM protein [Megasphaera]|uniref:TIGR01212 family radical SAM protein n=1 Tax=Megasphaera TaxID=906 RepID=UPI000B3BC7C0|nr:MULTISPECIES: TIGR01212 family radical SAM protein [Megasphaera]MBM6732337.1 TIGR01212 family radical SAM protein [Megasphaera stantonii]NJE34507.1 TIGR01212 family radical SAM protein [Megasphaera sp. SW808]OUO47399.1 TIGR01212 family radical SAM protein [Megasphaera sp. An286]
MNERYNVYSTYLKERYGEKVYKLPISIPDTCPNRDGTLGTRGCAFCGSIGAGYENLPADMTIQRQIEANIAHIQPKYKANKFIAYFQNFTNTYIRPDVFRQYLIEACRPDIVGIAVATRPDCVNTTYFDIMAEIKETYGVDILVEFGLQTVNYKTLQKINRGHTLAEYIDAMMMIQAYPFRNCTHVILDLPWDTMEDVVETAKIISALPTHEIKLHALYIIKNTVMADWYKAGEIQLISAEEYVDRVVTFLEYTRPDIVFQRLIGRAPKEATEFANWGMGWWKIRDMIDAELARRDTRQGAKCTYLHGKAVRKFTDY